MSKLAPEVAKTRQALAGDPKVLKGDKAVVASSIFLRVISAHYKHNKINYHLDCISKGPV